MAVQVERLVATLEARVDKYEKQLAKASRTGERQFQKIERRGEQMHERLESSMTKTSRVATQLVARLKGIGGALGIGAGILAGGALTAARVAIADLANVAAEAERAGLGKEAFQELAYAAAQSRVSVDALTDGMKELQLRADEFIVTGKGPAAEAFGRIGLSPQELKVRLEDPADLLATIIERVRTLDQAARIRVFDELFGGTGGEQFVRFLEQGSGAVQRLRKEAHDAGAVLSDEMLAKAKEIDREFNEIATTVGTALKGAIVAATAALTEFVETLPKAFEGSEETLQQSLMAVESQIEGIQANIDQARRTHNMAIIGQLQQYLSDLEQQRAELRRAVNMLEFSPAGGAATGVPLPRQRPEDVPSFRPIPPSADTGMTEAERAHNAMLREAETLYNATRTAAETYADTQDRLRQLLDAGVISQDTYNRGMAQAQVAMEEAAAAARELTAEQQFFGDVAVDSLSAIIVHGEDAADVMRRLAEQIADAALQAALLGQGPLGGLFGGGSGGGLLGGLLRGLGGPNVSAATASAMASGAGGLFASGGYTGSRPRDRVAGLVHGQEFVVNASATRQHRRLLEAMNAGDLAAIAKPVAVPSAGGPAVNAPISIKVDATGADAAGLRRLEAALIGLQHSLPRQVQAIVGDKRGRRGL